MNYLQIKDRCKKGYVGLIPGWDGYLKYNYADNSLYFLNNSYYMTEPELIKHIFNRTDLYYII